jgi:hypothetical protein
MSIIKKLAQARKMLAAKPLKKSGLNKFAGFQYFELADFMPSIVEIFAELEIVDSIRITNQSAALTLHDASDGCSEIEFACAVPEHIPDLKGQNPLQVVGSMQTYLRRYLYVTALGIVENDVVESLDSKSEERAAADAKAAYDALVVEKMGIITNIKTGIANQDLALSKESWDELTNDEKAILWKAPTKGGIFTTAERATIQSKEFRTALDNPATT